MSIAATSWTLYAWRHPRVAAAEGRCIGRTDVPVEARRARRLARRIHVFAWRNGLPRIVVTSPAARCRAVGQWLARWGWRHWCDNALIETDFGRWEGLAWADIPRSELDAWCADLYSYAPGGGESVAALLQRVRGFDPGTARVVVTHGGWLSAALWLSGAPNMQPGAEHWPTAPRPSGCVQLPCDIFGT